VSKKPLKKAKTAEQWAKEICAVHTRSVRRTAEDAIQLGRMLIEAKGTLPHGKFTEMVAHKLTFGPRTAQMLMAIAADERFQNPNHGSLFPDCHMAHPL
jgi:hypothetical protein